MNTSGQDLSFSPPSVILKREFFQAALIQFAVLKLNAKPKRKRELLSLPQGCFPCACSKPPATRKWLMPITVRPLPSTTQKPSETVWENSPVITKATYTSPSPQPAPGPSSPAPPCRRCPKQKSVSSAGDFWAGGERYKMGCLTQLIPTCRALCQDYSWSSPDALPCTASSDSS